MTTSGFIMDTLDTPVALIFFNRPECTRRVLQRVREVRPEKMYLIADAPRKSVPEDEVKCKKVRCIVDELIDWPCEIYKNYAESNLGCRMRPATGISWVFEHEESAIILEDDCLPDLSFFIFSREMLEKYRTTADVMLVSGTNSSQFTPPAQASYFFSRYSQTWGWATWRRAWGKYDIHLNSWKDVKNSKAWKDANIDPSAKIFFESKLDEIVHEGLDAWDYGWSFTLAINGGKSIIPAVNLIENIGFGKEATHTLNPTYNLFSPKSESLCPPYTHPASTDFFDTHDIKYAKSHYGRMGIKFREYLFKKFTYLRSKLKGPAQSD